MFLFFLHFKSSECMKSYWRIHGKYQSFNLCFYAKAGQNFLKISILLLKMQIILSLRLNYISLQWYFAYGIVGIVYVTTVCDINNSCTACYIYPGAHSLVKFPWQSTLFDQKEIEAHDGKFYPSKNILEINRALRHIPREGLCHKQDR